jgi:hypothetical protein
MAASTGSAGRSRTIAIAVIIAAIALAHVVGIGAHLRGAWSRLYSSYFSDIVIPFGMYLLLSRPNIRPAFLRDRRLRALVVLGVASAAEGLQALGVPALGRTFDPLDFVIYGGGVGLGTLVDRILPSSGSSDG